MRKRRDARVVPGRLTCVLPRAAQLAVLVILCLSAPLLAQGTLLDQGRAAIIRNEPERAAQLLERAVAQGVSPLPPELLDRRTDRTLQNLIRYLRARLKEDE